MRDPETPEEWQAAVDAAYAMLVLDSARQYGLVEGGPTADVGRCAEILRSGRARGIVPRADAPARLARGLASGGPPPAEDLAP